MKLVPTDSVEYQTHNTKNNQKYNFGIALAQGILIRISFAFTDPTTVLATFIYKLTQNNFLVGVTGSLMTTGWMWPQFLVSNLIELIKRFSIAKDECCSPRCGYSTDIENVREETIHKHLMNLEWFGEVVAIFCIPFFV